MFDVKETLLKLQEDKDYYGDFGRQFLSNSDIYSLLNDPRNFRKQSKETKAMIMGRYFHVSMLEPQKLSDFVIIDSTSRNTKNYKDQLKDTGLSIALLQQEADDLDDLVEVMKSNLTFYEAIYNSKNRYEVPAIKEIQGAMWKGKADILHPDRIIDIKTTSDISKFKYSAKKYNYDSQAYIYQKLFGYEMIFMVIDKTTKQIGVYDCSEKFLSFGEEKVQKAVESWNLFYNNPEFKPENYFINQTL